MPSIDKLRHNIRHAVSLSAFSPNLIHRIRYFFSLYSYFPRLLYHTIKCAFSAIHYLNTILSLHGLPDAKYSAYKAFFHTGTL